MSKKIKITALLALTLPLVLFLLNSFSGCGSDTIGPTTPPTNPSDTNVIIFDSLVVHEFFLQGSMSGVNLWLGKVTTAADTSKDMQLVDLNGQGVDFYFRSGDLSFLALAPGEQTRFNNIYDSLTQSQFDTLTKIPDSDNQLDSLDFTQDDTQFWGYFKYPLTQHRVYSFYLKGKYANGVTPKRVYGVIYLKNSYYSINETSFEISVRINKNGENWFKKH